MPKLALTGGAYKARSVIANAQRCVNLYPEINPKDSPFPTTHYPTPGLVTWATAPLTGPVRGLYAATTGVLYAVCGGSLFKVSSAGAFTFIGQLATDTGPVSMVDNGNVLCIVDNSENGGYVVDLTTDAYTPINSSSFYGSTRVDYVDTYFVFNRPNTNQFYITLSNLNFSIATNGPIQSGAITAAGSGYADGTLSNISLTGGAGSGAVATVTISGGSVTTANITDPGNNYAIGDVLTAALIQSGPILEGTVANGGLYYDDGLYFDVPLTGGSGTGANATITVSAGSVFSVNIIAGHGGTNYKVGDLLSASLPTAPSSSIPAFGFSFRVDSVTGVGGGFQYTVTAASTSVDSLDIAAKTGFPDRLMSAAVMHREIWLIGERTTEVWYNTGAADFTFGIMQGVFIEHGCVAPYSIAKQDLSLFWLARDQQGQSIVVQGAGYKVTKISTFAIDSEIQTYSRVDDAIGYCYQQDGHVFYVLTFPTANKTWVYDVATDLWHQRSSIDANGNLNRHRSNCHAFCYGKNIVGDYENGKLYELSLNAYTDDGVTIPRIRSFPHLENEGDRVIYTSFTADMEVGTLSSESPKVVLKWSDTRGVTFGNGVMQGLGDGGQYLTSVQWNRLGLGRDRIFELSWSAPMKTALNGAYVTVVPCGS